MLRKGSRPMKYNVIVTDFFPREEREWWKTQAPPELEVYFADNLEDNELRKLAKNAKALIVKKRELCQDLVDAMGSLQLILKFGHWPIGIDLDACQKAGITVATKPLLGEISVAEHTILLILACCRSLTNGHQPVIAGNYRALGLKPRKTSEKDISPNWMKLDVTEVYGKALGIIGFGEIGGEVAIRARSFGMRVIYYKRHPLPSYWEEELEVKYTKLSRLLRESDFVSLHVPHTEETQNMMGKKEFGLMKNSAYLINVARGGVVNENALLWALKNGEIKGAGLDVFVEEPIPHNHPLLGLNNVVFTPHTGGGSGQGLKVQAREALMDVHKFLKGEKTLHNLTIYEGKQRSSSAIRKSGGAMKL